MSANLETQYRGETSQLEPRVPIREKLTPEHFEQERAKGELLVVTDEHQFSDLDKTSLGLRSVHTEVWEDLVFVNFEETPRESLREWLGEMVDEYRGYFDGHERTGSYRVTVRCNWNLAVNSFTEGYQRHRPLMQLFRRHHRYSAPANPDHKLTPAEALAIRYGRKILPAFDGDMTGMPPGVYEPRTVGERISQQFFLSRGRQVFLEDLNTLEAQQEMLAVP
jgi:hypothetical protein